MISRIVQVVTFVIAVGTSLSGCASVSSLVGTSWQEEVLLHDGSKIVVRRSQSYGGNHELGQSAPIKDQTITFALPVSGRIVTWKSEYSDDIGRSNFKMVALHILHDTPYIIVVPNLCLSYNKWGRPNPPYVIFKHDEKQWQRIPLAELPVEFNNINLVVATKGEREVISAQSVVKADLVRKLNGELEQLEYRSILRQPIPHGGDSGCDEMVGNGKGDWIGFGGFSKRSSVDDCLRYCKQRDFDPQHCPCNRLFEGK